MSVLSNPIFHDEKAARAYFEKMRWPDGRACPHCGVVESSTLLKGKSHRAGLYKCKACLGHFTATVGTVYEHSKIALNKWLLATHLMCSSKKGISALQLMRELALGSYRTAWFMAHRIREAMTEAKTFLGGLGKVVEADETYYGKVENPSMLRTDGSPRRFASMGGANKRAIVALVERGGRANVFHVAKVDKVTILDLLSSNIKPESRLHTDESRLYKGSEDAFATHETIKHAKGAFARGDVNTNSAEGFFGVFKRGMRGIYQACSERHLKRYVTEFEFRYNYREKLGFDDRQRFAVAVSGTAGKRLSYRQTKT